MPELSMEDQHRLDIAIGNKVLREMYEDDNSAELTIELDNEGIHVTLISDTQPVIVPEDELYQIVGELVDTHQHAQTNLTRAVYRYQKEPTGRWDMKASFSYGT